MRFLARLYERLFGRSRRIEAKLDRLLEQQRTIMSKQDDLTKTLQAIDAATNKIATEVADLRLKEGDVITADQVALSASIQAKLESIAADPANPVPTDPAPAPTT